MTLKLKNKVSISAKNIDMNKLVVSNKFVIRLNVQLLLQKF